MVSWWNQVTSETLIFHNHREQLCYLSHVVLSLVQHWLMLVVTLWNTRHQVKMTSTSCDYEVPYHSRLVAKCCKYTHTGFWMMPLIELSQDTAPPTINPQNAMPSKIYIDTIINMCHQTTNVGNTWPLSTHGGSLDQGQGCSLNQIANHAEDQDKKLGVVSCASY